jgi:hypothetical protein
MHVSGRAGFPHDRGRAADVVGMAVREDQVPEVARIATELPDCVEQN